MPEPRFAFYEIVRVVSDAPELAEVDGERGVVLGRSEHEEEDGTFGYAVFILRDEICWNVAERDLEATGDFSSRAEQYGDEASIRVRVDEQGRGRIAE